MGGEATRKATPLSSFEVVESSLGLAFFMLDLRGKALVEGNNCNGDDEAMVPDQCTERMWYRRNETPCESCRRDWLMGLLHRRTEVLARVICYGGIPSLTCHGGVGGSGAGLRDCMNSIDPNAKPLRAVPVLDWGPQEGHVSLGWRINSLCLIFVIVERA